MATTRNPKVVMAQPYMQQARKPRNPQHRFNLRTQPWAIQPTMIAPVLPGETIANIHIQGQIWSEPLLARLKNTGWWCEHVFYYVKLRDLGADAAERASIANALVTGASTLATVLPPAAAVTQLFETAAAIGGAGFMSRALKRIVEEYWRFEGEDSSDFMIGNLPAASYVPADHRDWMDKLTFYDDYQDRREMVADASPTGDVSVDAIGRAYASWEALKGAGAMTMDFEAWMRTYGSEAVQKVETDPNLWRPEEIGTIRQWTYPTNTVEPSTGLPAVAVGWRVAERLDKKIFCHEPGFIVGVQCIRPKLYPAEQVGYASQYMVNQMHWLPAVLNDQIDVSHAWQENDTGPLASKLTDDEAYVWDIRDLLNYGDYYRNYVPVPADGDPFVGLPDANGQRRYATATDAELLFVDAAGEITLDKDIKCDGVISLTIHGRQQEQSPQIQLGGTYLTVPSPA